MLLVSLKSANLVRTQHCISLLFSDDMKGFVSFLQFLPNLFSQLSLQQSEHGLHRLVLDVLHRFDQFGKCFS